ncbi:septal ring lytic transglycosylase RlpA family protein [Mangrovivirga sp. M17]|uniref:Probable endolytic peptidoglycan transglycosylase RlpA n=1 Tax=Mangrovivirga halotolerans TaxID=2993936 RepID=A0ABT3RTG7_9BACT|nr:septal ring lytic transglycosylase RlpA family protein [Mangrovivirga halotolerans]MCX2744867.1 septal ring lytic transglycosylase RlpA family protein [Mangrovivirga halotolerans]
MRKTKFLFLIISGLVMLVSSNAIAQDTSFSKHTEEGIASYYHDKFTGRSTASGEKYDPKKLTAAHPKHPFGTVLKVTNLKTGASTTVTVNDRGPWVKGRIIDVSRVAAEKIGLIRAGLLKVKVEVISFP